MKELEIKGVKYQKLLQEILQNLQKTSEKITRQKVEMAWNIGKLVEEFLSENKDESYGQKLIATLEADTKISQTSLYKMRKFFQSYQVLPKDEAALNYSHYRVLAAISNKDERNYFEEITKQEGWSGDKLQKEVTKQIEKKVVKKPTKKPAKEIEKLKFNRGKLFNYQIKNLGGKLYLDLGFSVFLGFEGKFKEGDLVEGVKNNSEIFLQKSSASKKELHTYQAILERVVDGDTVIVNLDLGFNVLHQEKLRLAKIDAQPSETKEGKIATKKLEEILKNAQNLIVKTNKTDIYGRFIADIFLENVEGDYLNQMRLDFGVVEVF
jgi:hypothetical protein